MRELRDQAAKGIAARLEIAKLVEARRGGREQHDVAGPRGERRRLHRAVERAATGHRHPAAFERRGREMTGVFGVVRNTGSGDVVLSSVTTSASARAELHTTVTEGGAPTMKAVESMTIPPGGSLILQPGGDHVMVLDLTKPIAVGDTVTVTLATKDGKKLEFPAVAKQFTGANEPYHSGAGTNSVPAHTSS